MTSKPGIASGRHLSGGDGLGAAGLQPGITALLATASTLPLTLFILLPVETYFQNQVEFVCSWKDVAVAGVPSFILCSMGLALLLLLLRRLGKQAGLVSQAALLAFTALMVLEAGPFSYRLPQLDGNFSGYESVRRTVVDALAWAGLLFVAIRIRAKLVPRALPACMAIILFCVANIVHLQATTKVSIGELKIRDAHVINAAGFNRDNNVLILSLDMVLGQTLRKILLEDQGMRDRLPGFTNFVNNIAMHPITMHVLPSMLHGEPYDGLDLWGHFDKVFTAKNSLIRHFTDENYAVFMLLNPLLTFTNRPAAGGTKTNKTSELYALGTFPWHVQDMTCFRILPFGLKRHFVKVARRLPAGMCSDVISFKEKDFYALLAAKVDNRLPMPTLHAYQTMGAHYPFYLDAEGNQLKDNPRWSDINAYRAQVTAVFSTVLDFLDLLRKKGLYDSSTIVITSDHGYDFIDDKDNFGIPGRFTPLLMVKPRQANAPYAESRAPMSSGQIGPLLIRIAEAPDPSEQLREFTRTLPKVRLARLVFSDKIIDRLIDENLNQEIRNTTVKEAAIGDLVAWALNKAYSSSPHFKGEPIPPTYTTGIDRNGGIGFEMRNDTSGEVKLLAPKGIGRLDLTLRISSVIDGTLVITNRRDGRKYPVRLIGGQENHKILTPTVADIRVPASGILDLLFEVKGVGRQIAFLGWKLSPTPRDQASTP